MGKGKRQRRAVIYRDQHAGYGSSDYDNIDTPQDAADRDRDSDAPEYKARKSGRGGGGKKGGGVK